MPGQLSVQLSNGRAVLCPTVQWLESAVSNSPMVGQYIGQLSSVQLSNGPAVHQ